MPPFVKEINRQFIVDAVAEKLQQFRVVGPDLIIYNILFTDVDKPLWKATVFTRKEQGVKVITHNAA